jgi:hypothetical protein
LNLPPNSRYIFTLQLQKSIILRRAFWYQISSATWPAQQRPQNINCLWRKVHAEKEPTITKAEVKNLAFVRKVFTGFWITVLFFLPGPTLFSFQLSCNYWHLLFNWVLD